MRHGILEDTDLERNHQWIRVQKMRRNETFRSCLYFKGHSLAKWQTPGTLQ